MIGTIIAISLLAQDPDPEPAIYTLEVSIKDGEHVCARTEDTGPATADAVSIEVVLAEPWPDGVTAPEFETVNVDDVRFAIGDSIKRSALAPAKKGEATVVLVGDADEVPCGEQQLFRIDETGNETGNETDNEADDPKRGPDTRLDAEARDWWAKRVPKEGKEENPGNPGNPGKKETTPRSSVLGKATMKQIWDAEHAGSPRRGRKNAVLLTHLPSGAPASPFPSSVREGALVQVAVIRPTTGKGSKISYRLEVESCASVEPFGLKGGEGTQGKEGEPAKEGESAADGGGEFELVPIGQWMRCGAGPLEYKLTASKPDGTGFDGQAATKTRLRTREVHHLAAAATIGFDASRLPTFGLQASNDGMQQLVTSGEEYGGLKVLLGAQWMIGGVDYEDMRWFNYFANLFVAVNVAKPLDGATFGMALTPTGGISLALGLSLSKTKQLGNGMEVGDVFTGEGDVPINTNWEDPGVGPFIGLTIDHRLYEALVAKFR